MARTGEMETVEQWGQGHSRCWSRPLKWLTMKSKMDFWSSFLKTWMRPKDLLLRWLSYMFGKPVLVVGEGLISSTYGTLRSLFECPHNMSTAFPPEWVSCFYDLTSEVKLYHFGLHWWALFVVGAGFTRAWIPGSKHQQGPSWRLAVTPNLASSPKSVIPSFLFTKVLFNFFCLYMFYFFTNK